MDPKPHDEQKEPLTGLVGAATLVRILFPDPATALSVATVRILQRRGELPHMKIGRRVFFNPGEVRRALEEKFSAGK